MSAIDDKDDWSNESASLFREARRAHDPTLAESARLASVLARIQAGNVESSFPANAGTDIAARGATSAMLRSIGSVSLGVVCIATLSLAVVQFNRHSPEPAHSAAPVPAAVASASPPIAMQPVVVSASESSASVQTSAAQDRGPSRTRAQRRRSRAAAEKQRTSRIDVASVPEASSSAAQPDSASATAPERRATRQESVESGRPVMPAAAQHQATRRPVSSEFTAREAVTEGVRKGDSARPKAPPTELAMMKRMQDALHEADFSAVFALCAEHARRWPHGVFELEREGVRAIASCGEHSDDAALRAERFLSAHPHAPVAMRVRAACAAELKKR